MKMTKSLVVAPFIPIAAFMASHRAAQGVVYADMIAHGTGEDVTINFGGNVTHDFNDFDKVYVYHGNDWSGGLNLYGGTAGFPYAWNFRNLTHFKGPVTSIAIPFPDYHRQLTEKLAQDRGNGRIPDPAFDDIDWDNLKRMESAPVIVHPNRTSSIAIGDSHGVSMYRPGWTIHSTPMRTLKGQMKKGFIAPLLEVYESLDQVEHIELNFGNIDLRHHLCRKETKEGTDLWPSPTELADQYYMHASSIYACQGMDNLKSVVIYELMPCEEEERKLPQSGYFMKKPFWGTWAERMAARKEFNDRLEMLCGRADNGVSFYRWTEYLLNKKGEMNLHAMEYKKSVHLSRMAYPHWTGVEYNTTQIKDPKKQGLPANVVRPPSVSLESFF
jgi:hypothetical protein